jgi:hypothetical protein
LSLLGLHIGIGHRVFLLVCVPHLKSIGVHLYNVSGGETHRFSKAAAPTTR